MSRALRLCPGAVRLSPRFERYAELSRQVMDVFHSVTPLVEPLSLDEAFLDVTGRLHPYGGLRGLAVHLKKEVRRRTGLALSIGAGTNKTVAKIASDLGKPDGLLLVAPGSEARFLADLPVRSLWGVGPRAEKVLHEAGYRTIGDIAAAAPEALEARFGSRGRDLWDMANGRDERPIVTEWERKSVGAETTFPRDLEDGPELRSELHRIAVDTTRRLNGGGFLARTIAIKLRYSNFRTISRQSTRAEPTDDESEIEAAANALLDRVVQEGDRFRLIGIHCSNLVESEQPVEQPSLFERQ
jgi:DNA polymerase-4